MQAGGWENKINLANTEMSSSTGGFLLGRKRPGKTHMKALDTRRERDDILAEAVR